MNRQAQVGLFMIVAIAALVVGLYFLSDYGTRSRGYKVGIHFQSASGLHQAALVYLSGVPIGVVDSIELLPDYSTDVIIAVKQQYEIPRGSRFLIQAPLTGDPSVLIVPPPPASEAVDKEAAERALAVLPHEVLPLDQQPKGFNSSTVADLVDEGQGQIRRLDRILAQVETATPELLKTLQQTIDSAGDLTKGGTRSLELVNARITSLTDQLAQLMTVTGGNVNDLTATLDSTAKSSSAKIDTLLTQLNATSKSLATTTASLQGLATDPRLKENLLETTHQLAVTTRTVAEITNDFRQVTGNPETQAQLRDTIANLDATTERINSLVGSLGGRSNVYGVDRGAPKPVASSSPGPSGSSGDSGTSSVPNLVDGSGDTGPPRAHIGVLSGHLVSADVRLSILSAQPQNSVSGSKLLTADRGPQTDLGLTILPQNPTSLFFSFNDIGENQSATAVVVNQVGRFSYGGGLEYSRLGLQGALRGRHLGLELLGYDPRHPTLDGYGKFYVTPLWQIFLGERDSLHADRRTVFGLQAQF